MSSCQKSTLVVYSPSFHGLVNCSGVELLFLLLGRTTDFDDNNSMPELVV